MTEESIGMDWGIPLQMTSCLQKAIQNLRILRDSHSIIPRTLSTFRSQLQRFLPNWFWMQRTPRTLWCRCPPEAEGARLLKPRHVLRSTVQDTSSQRELIGIIEEVWMIWRLLVVLQLHRRHQLQDKLSIWFRLVLLIFFCSSQNFLLIAILVESFLSLYH